MIKICITDKTKIIKKHLSELKQTNLYKAFISQKKSSKT